MTYTYPQSPSQVGGTGSELQGLESEDHLPLVGVGVEPELRVGQRGVGEHAELHVVRTHRELVQQLRGEADLADEVALTFLSGGVEDEQYVCRLCVRARCLRQTDRFTLRAPLSGTFLQTLPDLVTPPLKGYSLSPRSCPPTRSAPSERFGY